MSNQSALVTFDVPFDDGGTAITGYTATATPDPLSGEATVTGTDIGSPIWIYGLTNDVAYTITVHATNANGDGPESAPSAPYTPVPAPV